MLRVLPESLFSPLGTRTRDHERMPGRVSALVIAEEWRSERLIGWVQLTVTLVFAALYAIAPRPSDAMDAMFEPVPLVLMTYAGFTAVRLVAAYRGFLPGWLLLVSMIADVALLYALIFTFHIAYAQPPAFSLKVPTFAYIFVFIAIRALRFDPRFVVGQGLIAAAGWVTMLVFVLASSGTEVVTRSFVSYMTENLVLIGAEFDKVGTILLVTAVLALALVRARRTLFDAVREGAARRDMGRFFGAGVAEAITSNEHAAAAGDATRVDAAILMLDLRGFTSFAGAHPPETVVATLTRYHRFVLPIIEAHGGVVDKFLGDGVMATFGALRPSETAAADALAALCEIIAGAAAWDDALAAEGLPAMPINGAAVAGRIVAATVGNENRLEFTVIGTAPNLAARVEKHNKVAGTKALTTSETYERACREGFARPGEPIGPADLRTGGAPVELVKLA